MKSSSYYQYLLYLLLPTHSLGWSSLSSASRITTCRGSRASSTAILVQTNDNDNDDDTTTADNTVELLLLSRSDAIRNIVTKSLIVIGSSATVVAVGGRGSVVANAVTDDSTNNKKAVVSISMTALAALRILQRTQTQLSIQLLPFIEKNDYVGVKGALRQPPFDTIRKNASILVDNEISATNYKQLQNQYKLLIGALEKMDNTSSLGMRGGRSVPTIQLQEDYDTFTLAFENFLKVSSTSYPMAPPPIPATGTPATTTTSENNNSNGGNIDSTSSSSTPTTLEK
mmetsp:Transcript_9187/g.10621  ORF Transcript_9187/g.10621 Transcript_9187/m.10621 type:complete len:285 (-) Transcript_9187:341-1195(-)